MKLSPILKTQVSELRNYGKTYAFNQSQLNDLLDVCITECLLVDYEKKPSNGIENNLNGFVVYQLGGDYIG